jgi:hypothetical protein
MSAMEPIDFPRIQFEAAEQAARIKAIKLEFQKLLGAETSESVNHLNSGIPPLSDNRPLMFSRMDRIQTRLSQLAAALSPSNRSTPVNNPVVCNRMPREAKFKAEIDTPEDEISPSSSSEEFIFEPLDKDLGAGLTFLHHKLASRIRRLRERETMLNELMERFAHEIDDRQKHSACKIIERLQTALPQITGEPSKDAVCFNIEDRVDALRIGNRQELLGIIHEATNKSYAQQLERLHNDVASLTTINEAEMSAVVDIATNRVHSAIAHIRSHYNSELLHISKKLLDRHSDANQNSPDIPIVSKLQKQNSILARECRRLKIALSKWKADCLNHETKKVRIETASTDSQHVLVGDSFHELAHTLFRMWEALPPTGNDCARLLSRISQSIQSQGRVTLSDALKHECNMQVEKLPLAELAARRDYLLAKAAVTEEDIQELQILTANLEALISEFENKHKEKFLVDGEEYMHRLNSREYHRP